MLDILMFNNQPIFSEHHSFINLAFKKETVNGKILQITINYITELINFQRLLFVLVIILI